MPTSPATTTIFLGLSGDPFNGLNPIGVFTSVDAVELDLEKLHTIQSSWWAPSVQPIDNLDYDPEDSGFVIATGNPVDGLSFHGPVNDAEDATAWAEHETDDDWWLLPVGSVQA